MDGPLPAPVHRLGLAQGPYEADRLFHRPGLCIWSYAAARTGTPAGAFDQHALPTELFGEIEHTHRAIDDALGYAHLLVALMTGAVLRQPGQAATGPGS